MANIGIIYLTQFLPQPEQCISQTCADAVKSSIDHLNLSPGRQCCIFPVHCPCTKKGHLSYATTPPLPLHNHLVHLHNTKTTGKQTTTNQHHNNKTINHKSKTTTTTLSQEHLNSKNISKKTAQYHLLIREASKKHREIANGCLVNISSVVEVSSCS